MKRAVLILTVVGCVGLAIAQAPPAPLEFEVASVKASKQSNNGVRGGCHGIDSKYSPTQAAAGHIINIAWDLRSMNLIKGGPNWAVAGTTIGLVSRQKCPTRCNIPTRNFGRCHRRLTRGPVHA